MQATRTFLIQKGMTSELADTLAKRYLNLLEESQIFSILDLFSSSTSHSGGLALSALQLSNLSTDVTLNYQTWSDYSQTLFDKAISSAV
jgi:hypothetical protein